jgi:phosphodiesterase/alkaline phosphatase D-like protein
MRCTSWLRRFQRQPRRADRGNSHKPRPPRFLPTLEELEARLVPKVSFLAVAAGDATSTDAILWTRAQDSTTTAGVPVKALVSTDPGLSSGSSYAGVTDPSQDYTLHLDATDLQSGTTYYYRFLAPDGSSSQEGTFKTAPDPSAHVAVHFGFTGDADGLMRPYPAADNVTAPGVPTFANQHFDYFVWLGDTIYETASGGTGPNASPATPSTASAANLTPAGLAAMEKAYWAKYRQQFQPVSTGPDPGLQEFFSSTGHYTLLDNHELGNKQVINGGAPAGNNPFGIGVNASNPANDVNTTGAYINQSPVFQTLVQAYTDYQPIRVHTVFAPNDPRSNGTQQLYFAQQWGANSIFFNLDDRSYRDIRLKKADGTTDDTGVRADNPGRTMLGATQLNWFEQGLLAAQAQGITRKFVAISSPIDQIGAIGSGADGGKSWMGGYRYERNQLLQFIAANHIDHVVFLTTDDHQVRINDLGYFTQFDAHGTPIQSSYTRVPGCFQILVGPIGATGPDLITDHSIANIRNIAQTLANQQIAAGVDPIGLDPNFPGLINVSREGDPNANTNRSPFDFYSPDTFNYAVLDVDPSGHNFTVTIDGINSYPVNTFPQPNPNNPVRQIMQFTITTDTLPAQPTTVNLTERQAAVNVPVATFTDPTTTFTPGNLLVSRSVYSGSAGTVKVGQTLPGGGTAVADGSYPNVFQNAQVDGSFGVTSPIFLDQLTTSGTPVGNPVNVTASFGNTLATSFSSKSELALNLSADGTAVTFMGYESPVNALDVSNSNTPGVIDPTNPVKAAVPRAVVQIDANANLQVTPVNAYSGNNGRAAILGSTGDYYMTGNAGNSGKGPSGTTLGNLSNNTGVQMVVPGGGPQTTVVGQVNGTFGSTTGYQRGFAVQLTNPLTGKPYGKADKTGKDDNFRGETIFDNTLYVTKGSGGNGINTVYQVGTAGSLPTFADAGTLPITVLPGFPAGLAANIGNDTPAEAAATEFFPFGIWFANPTTLYVADEGNGVRADAGNLAKDPNAGLEKWSLVNGVWHLDYTLQNGLNLGQPYTVANGPGGEVYPKALNPATDGLRNLTGKVNADGTVTLYAITSTVSTSGDQGADPNKLVAITDDLSATTLPGNEQFTTLKSARYGEVLRGVSFTPNPSLDHYTATVDWGDGSPPSTGTISLSGATFTVSGSHTYQEEGVYPVTTTITHQGKTTVVTGTANIRENLGILLLDASGSNALQAACNGSVQVTGGGSIVVNTSSIKAAFAADNSVVSAAEIDARGVTTQDQGAFVGTIDTGESPEADPLATLAAPPVPGVVQSTSTLFIATSTTLEPGLYEGGIRISGDAQVTLAPGIYYLQGGGLAVSGQATVTDNGLGVLVYNAAGKGGAGISISGNAVVSLTGLSAAQLAGLGLTDPSYAGLVGLAIFQDRQSPAAFSVSDNANVTITGTIYAAAAPVQVTGSATLMLQGDAAKQFGSHLLVADLSVKDNGSVTVDASVNDLETF